MYMVRYTVLVENKRSEHKIYGHRLKGPELEPEKKV